jgi:hypothetical protein
MEQAIEPGIYEHYKGNRYEVTGVARHTETGEDYVVYTPLYEHPGQPNIWIRPLAMFMQTVEVKGEIISRFKKVSEK